jgi:hypothetical protein
MRMRGYKFRGHTIFLLLGNYVSQNNFINNTVTRLWRVLAYFVEVIFLVKEIAHAAF